MIRIGLVDFDTSHVVAFTQRLNGIDCPPEQRVDGARVVAGCPGDSLIMPERIPGYTETLRGWGIELVEKPQELIGKVDAVFITSQQGARHLGRFRLFAGRDLPIFVDKPFAGTQAQAEAMIRTARDLKTPLMSCSALRYDPTIKAAKAKGPIKGAEVWGPASLHDGNPGLLHYGCHMAEMLYTLLGPGCQEVRMLHTPGTDVVTGIWKDGRVGILRGIRDAGYAFGFAAHYEKGQQVAAIDGSAYYTEMLKEIVAMCQTKVEPIPLMETWEISAFMDAAWRSAKKGGRAERLKRGFE